MKKKVWVRVDVCSFSPRAFLLERPIMATSEIGRVVQALQGVDWGTKLGEDIFSELSAKEQRRIVRMCGMLGTSGPRGDIEVEYTPHRVVSCKS
ncbi:MAG: hypothetical protein DDT23_01015 [candidate division WS2 bacterium]|nr:hypothetical protein [Candidatus Lithacetigena glycinireducens]